MLYFRFHAEKGGAMDVTVAVLADYANVSQDGKLNIMGIFQEVNPSEIPFVLPQMYLVLSLTAGPAEVGLARTIRIPLLYSDGQEILSLQAQMRIPSSRRPGSRVLIHEAIGLAGLTFPQAGDYAFHILIGDDDKATVPLHVNEPLQEVTND
jgi:hypothetical protein